MKPKGSRESDTANEAGAVDRRAIDGERSAADADQVAADADQTSSDADQTTSEQEDAAAVRDQAAADADQANADRQQPEDADAAGREAYETSRTARQATRVSRVASHLGRVRTARTRMSTAADRDATAARRDEAARRRDVQSDALEHSIAASDTPLAEKLEQLRSRAASDRARAAADRSRAAQDRADAALERARLDAELYGADLDDLTGAFRVEIGTLALAHELDRARRGNTRFVIAAVDVTGLQGVNEVQGRFTGDHLLRTVVSILRSNLGYQDPIVHRGGDSFLCGLGGADLDGVERRFDAIGRSVLKDFGVGIRVGLAAPTADETLGRVVARADAALQLSYSQGTMVVRDSRLE